MAEQSFFDFRVPSIDGAPDLLGPLRGKVVLAVNVASRCGFTPQYTGLQQLYDEMAAVGFAVVGFPCNQFGAQEPTDIRSTPGSVRGVAQRPLATFRGISRNS
jgi:glutathione peroxidase